jgi:hypothetical protein
MAMTESEWLACAEPTPMLKFLLGKASDRKLRLFVCACCRGVWHLLADGGRSRSPKSSRYAVEVAERYADGKATEAELADASHGAWAAAPPPPDAPVTDAYEKADYATLYAAWVACDDASRGAEKVTYFAPDGDAVGDAAGSKQAALLHDIFGYPLRPSPFLADSVLRWNDGTVRRLAESIYEERKMPEGTLDTARLTILADALLDAGCEDEALIAHCREQGAHVRGCWAIDLILGKA